MNDDQAVFWIFMFAAVPVNLYALFYTFRPWRRTAQGQALWVKSIGNVIVIDVVLATLVFGEDYPGREVIRVVGFATFAVGISYLFLSLVFSEGASRYPPWSWLPRSLVRRWESWRAARRG